MASLLCFCEKSGLVGRPTDPDFFQPIQIFHNNTKERPHKTLTTDSERQARGGRLSSSGIIRPTYISDPEEQALLYYSIGAVVAAVAAEVRLFMRPIFFHVSPPPIHCI